MYIVGGMVKTQIKSLTIIFLILALFHLSMVRAEVVIRNWESLTSFNQVNDMIRYKGEVWAATNGGLVRINPESMGYDTYTNVDGLEMIRIHCLAVDDQNRLWVGGRGRLVDFSDPAHPDGYLFTDRDGSLVEIYDIACAPGGDSLWLANQLGVTIFLAGDERGTGLILDTYTRLGEIDRDTPARRVALDEDSIWAGTVNGLAVGSRFDIRQLKAPTGWESYFPSRLAPVSDDFVRAMVILRDTIYIGAAQGAYRFDRTAVPELISINLFLPPPLVYNMSLIGDTILINSVRGSAFYRNGSFTWMPTQGLPYENNTAAGTVDSEGKYWAGHLFNGIYFLDVEESKMIPFNAGGTPANECMGVVAAQGKIWGAFGNQVMAFYENGRWTALPGVSGILKTLEVGPLGEIWVGTHENGVFRVLGDSIAHFKADNSPLSGTPNNPAGVVVPGIYASGDAVWFANWRGRDGELVAVNPYNLDQWQSYVFIGGDNADQVVTVAAGQEVVYAGSEENGIYAVAYAGTPFYTGDDYRWTFNSSNSGIGSDFINYLTIDGYDSLWVGTSYGLSYQSLGEIYFTNIILPLGFGPEVRTIAFDGQGSLYAGSGRGLAVRYIGTGLMEYLTTKNSGLVDDIIRDIYFDANLDIFWISTSGGISRMTMGYQLATRDIEKVLAYPNPFIIRYGTEKVRFNYSGLAEIRIYTLAGELVREIPINGEWDGRNAFGETVASGVYLFTLTGAEQEVGRGKILLIRE